VQAGVDGQECRHCNTSAGLCRSLVNRFRSAWMQRS